MAPVLGGRALPAGEGRRKLVHAGMGAFALLFRFLTWPQAVAFALVAFLFNWQVLPRLLGHRLTSAREGVSDRGVLIYPVVVLALILLFRDDLALAAFGWGVLAFGDAAAGTVGQKWGRHPLPWNARKSWEGLAAFVVAALLGGGALVVWTAQGGSPAARGGGLDLVGLMLPALVAVSFAALLEGLPHGLDDNVLPPLVAPALLAMSAPLATAPLSPATLGWALAVNTACAVIALATRALRPGGVAVAWALGVSVWLAATPRGFLLLLVFLLAGTAVTFLGYGRKRARGVAEGHGGRRGAVEIFGKGGFLLVLAFTALAASASTPSAARVPGWVVVAVLAAATADTWGTEIGGLLGRRAFTLLPPAAVPPGTAGAVSWAGLAGAAVGAAAIAGCGAGLGLVSWGVAAIAAAAALGASVVESLLPQLGEATHTGKNLVVTVLAPLLTMAALGVLR